MGYLRLGRQITQKHRRRNVRITNRFARKYQIRHRESSNANEHRNQHAAYQHPHVGPIQSHHGFT